MRRVRENDDEQALAALIRRYETPLYSFARNMLGNANEAEDIFQETFLRVHQNRLRYKTGAQFRPWIYRIAANLCYDRLRWWKRRPAASLEADEAHLSERVPSSAPTPDSAARRAELRRALDSAIALLPTKHRAVFIMARYDGLSYEEIAHILEIPVGTVKSRMNKAVTVLMQQLKDFQP